MKQTNKVSEAVYQFEMAGDLLSCEPYGNGHINETYLVRDSAGKDYILQKVNGNVFKDRQSLMNNISSVTEYLRGLVESDRETLRLIPTKDGNKWLVDETGEYWRMYPFITESLCFDKTENADMFRESGRAFGRFQRLLADFPSRTLVETIPRFHDTPWRYEALKKAIREDVRARAADCRAEIDFALEREKYAAMLVKLLDEGGIPLRVVHNDTKLNNVLFDEKTKEGMCVIDLDTVMPGLSVNDFGDSIRFGASTAAEDETDLSKVSFSLPLFEAYTEGFIGECGKSLTDNELSHLCDGAKIMTLECGIRFLTDYLAGDTYFKIHRERHNLDRCRTQFKLVSDMESNWTRMQSVVERIQAANEAVWEKQKAKEAVEKQKT